MITEERQVQPDPDFAKSLADGSLDGWSYGPTIQFKNVALDKNVSVIVAVVKDSKMIDK